MTNTIEIANKMPTVIKDTSSAYTPINVKKAHSIANMEMKILTLINIFLLLHRFNHQI